MTVQDILNALDDYGFQDTNTTRKVAIINDAIWDICSREPWPFLEKTIDLTFAGNSNTPSNWPTDFQATLDLIRTDGAMTSVIDPTRLDELHKRYASNLNDVGDPLKYYFLGSQLYVWPTPGAAVTLKMPYIALHPQVDSSTTETGILIPKQHHTVILYGALSRLYDMEDDPELSARFEQHYETRLQTMRNALWMRQYDRPDRIAVIGHDDFDVDYYL